MTATTDTEHRCRISARQVDAFGRVTFTLRCVSCHLRFRIDAEGVPAGLGLGDFAIIKEKRL